MIQIACIIRFKINYIILMIIYEFYYTSKIWDSRTDHALHGKLYINPCWMIFLSYRDRLAYIYTCGEKDSTLEDRIQLVTQLY